MKANTTPTETKTLGVADLINAAHRAELVRQFEAGEIGEGTITDFDKVSGNTMETKNLIEAANTAYLAFYAATLNAPKTPEFERLRAVNDELRQAIVHARNAATVESETFYVYTPIDGDEDGKLTGYTLEQAKELARKYAAEPGNDRGAQVRRNSDSEIVWSI